jgi:CubicO group peptidase (beta-lactamase class C family)
VALAAGVVVLAVFLLRSPAPEKPAAVPRAVSELDSLVEEARKFWNVPGVAVAVVRDDQVIYLRGFGVREIGKPELVTPDTLFPLASCTKSFTTTALAMLVTDGKLDWDDPVRKHVPQFHLADPLADSKVTIRDLVTHRTGVGSNDFLWYRSPWNREEVVRRVGLVKPKYPFRAGFAYQSTMFTVAGMAVESASGKKWEDFVRERICTPLALKNLAFTTPEARANPDHATPHRIGTDERIGTIPGYEMERPEPAGSIYASARDLAQFVRFQLGDGSFEGKRLTSAEALNETHLPQNIIPLQGEARALHPEAIQMSYGMGWVIEEYQGRQLVSHGGQIDGFRVHITLVPQERLGIVLLNNLDRTQMNLAVSNAIIDRLLKLPARNWSNVFRDELYKESAEAHTRQQEWLARRNPSAGPSRALAAYAGRYSNPAYDAVRIEVDGGRLVWKWHDFVAPLTHYQFDTFMIENDALGSPRVVFTLDADGNPVRMSVSHPLEAEFQRDNHAE